jgi:hypothetical protein
VGGEGMRCLDQLGAALLLEVERISRVPTGGGCAARARLRRMLMREQLVAIHAHCEPRVDVDAACPATHLGLRGRSPSDHPSTLRPLLPRFRREGSHQPLTSALVPPSASASMAAGQRRCDREGQGSRPPLRLQFTLEKSHQRRGRLLNAISR